jgi:hypothetical protein
MGSTRLRVLLLQSYLMRLLVTHVFRVSEDSGLVWAGSLSRSLRQIHLALIPGWSIFFDVIHTDKEIESSIHTSERLMNNDLYASELRDYSIWKAKSALLISKR